MIEPTAQGALETLSELDALLNSLYPILESAVQDSRQFFPDDEPVDQSLYPNLVRYYVKRALNAKGLDVVTEESVAIDHTILSNNGLLLRYGGRYIRIRKADHGGLPAATSGALRDFYEQRSLLEEAVEIQKLMLLWDTVEGVLELSLVCPKTHDSSPHWQVPVEHPATLHEADSSEDEVSDFDLPIDLPRSATDAQL